MTITYSFLLLLFNLVFYYYYYLFIYLFIYFNLFQTGERENELFILVQLVDFIIFGKSIVQSSLIGFIAGYSKLYNQN
jgi:hypothetical protein